MDKHANDGLNSDADWLSAYYECVQLAAELGVENDECAILDATAFTSEFEHRNAVNRMIIESTFNENET